MTSYLIRRILWIIPVLFVVSVITFTLMHLTPGGPWAREKRLSPDTERRQATRWVRPASRPGRRHLFTRYRGGTRRRHLGVRCDATSVTCVADARRRVLRR